MVRTLFFIGDEAIGYGFVRAPEHGVRAAFDSGRARPVIAGATPGEVSGMAGPERRRPRG